jgi:antitoxin component of MazEF toxin-antitoxin module
MVIKKMISKTTITSTKERIVIEAAQRQDYKLEDLLAGMTDDNTHAEVDFGRCVGREDL